MPGLKSGFGEQIQVEFNPTAQGSVPSSAIGGLSSRRVVYGSPSGGVAQSAGFEYDSTQNFLGVGSSAPLTKVYLESSAGDAFISARTLDSSGYVGFAFWDTAANLAGSIGYANTNAAGLKHLNIAPRKAGESLVFGIGTTETARMNSSGHWGILTTAPVEVFDVNGAVRVRSNTPSFGAVSSNLVLDYVSAAVQAPSRGRIAAVGGSLELMTGTPNVAMLINSSGHVGIGTTAPQFALHVEGNPAFTPGILVNQTGTTAFESAFLTLQTAVGTTGEHSFNFDVGSTQLKIRLLDDGRTAVNRQLMSIRANGNVGIGTTAPGAILDVAGIPRLTTANTTAVGTTGAGAAPPASPKTYLKVLLADGTSGRIPAYTT